MDPTRAKVMNLALEQIDRNPDQYDTVAEQNEMLALLIKTHELKDNRTKTALTVDRYRDMMQYVVNRSGSAISGKNRPKIQRLLHRRSQLVPRAVQDRLNQAAGTAVSTTREACVETQNNQGSHDNSNRLTQGIKKRMRDAVDDEDGSLNKKMRPTIEASMQSQNDQDTPSTDEAFAQGGKKRKRGFVDDEAGRPKKMRSANGDGMKEDEAIRTAEPSKENGQRSLFTVVAKAAGISAATSEADPTPTSIQSLAEPGTELRGFRSNPTNLDNGAPNRSGSTTSSFVRKRKPDEPLVGAPVGKKMKANEVVTDNGEKAGKVNLGQLKILSLEESRKLMNRPTADKDLAHTQLSTRNQNDQVESVPSKSGPAMGSERPAQEPRSDSGLFKAPRNDFEMDTGILGWELPPPRTDEVDPRRLRPMEPRKINDFFEHVRYIVKQRAYTIVDDTGFTWTQPVDWNPNPTPELEELYERVFGEDWKGVSVQLGLSGEFNVRDMLMSLLAAALYNVIFDKDLPSIGPQEAAEAMKGLGIYLSEVIMQWGADKRPCTFNTAAWMASQKQSECQIFKFQEIRPVAKDLARTFMITVTPQLRTLGASKFVGQGQTAEQFWAEKMHELISVFAEALILKGSMRASKHYYEHTWFTSNTTYDTNTMNQMHMSKPGSKIKYCLTPIVWWRTTKDGEQTVAKKVQVQTPHLPLPPAAESSASTKEGQ